VTRFAVIKGSALQALNGDAKWEKTIDELMEAVDKNVPLPVRDVDKPFAMPIEDIFSISGRGTVVTGRIERGKVKVGEEVEIVGFRPTQKKVVTGVEMFKKLLTKGLRAITSACCCAARKRRRGARASGLQARFDHPAHEVQGGSIRLDEGRRRPSHAVFLRVSSTVLFRTTDVTAT